MPTGYTYMIEEGATFEEFVWACARAFGALYNMREDPMDTEISFEVKPSTHHLELLNKAESEYRSFVNNSKSSKWVKQQTDESNKRRLDYYLEDAAKRKQLNSLYSEMERKVQNWIPPTKDHNNLREFMLQQIGISKSSYVPEKPTPLTTEEWKKMTEDGLLRDISYHKKEYERDVQRANENTQWLQALNKSIPCRVFKGK